MAGVKPSDEKLEEDLRKEFGAVTEELFMEDPVGVGRADVDVYHGAREQSGASVRDPQGIRENE